VPYELSHPPAQTVMYAVGHAMDCRNCNDACVHPRQKNQPFPCIDGISAGQAWETVETVIRTLIG
jgi:hypothetical protein